LNLTFNKTRSTSIGKNPATALDPAGTKISFKVSEIVMRINRKGSPRKSPIHSEQ